MRKRVRYILGPPRDALPAVEFAAMTADVILLV